MDREQDIVSAWRRLNSVDAKVIDLHRVGGAYTALVESDLGRRGYGIAWSIAGALTEAATRLGYRVEGDRLVLPENAAA